MTTNTKQEPALERDTVAAMGQVLRHLLEGLRLQYRGLTLQGQAFKNAHDILQQLDQVGKKDGETNTNRRVRRARVRSATGG